VVDRENGENSSRGRYSDWSLHSDPSGSVCAFFTVGRSVLACSLGSWRLLNGPQAVLAAPGTWRTTREERSNAKVSSLVAGLP
jgi:hypothetical protein